MAFLLTLALTMGIPISAQEPMSDTVGTLVIGILAVESSYKDNVEQPAAKVHDTVQFWLTRSATWRIRTYAMDHDIHTYTMGLPSGDPVAFVRSHIERKYSDVLDRIIVLHLGEDSKKDSLALADAELPGTVERAPNGLVFWNPDAARYHTQSTPQ